MPQLDPDSLLARVRDIALAAGDAILEVYGTDFAVRAKDDASPVTAADEAAEAIILPALRALTPGVPVIAEEESAAGLAPDTVAGGAFWLVDPLDGTKEFIKRNGEFTVNIALVRGRNPALGVVHAPALGESYWGAGPGTAWFARTGEPARPIAARPPPPDGLVVAASRSHGDGAALAAFLKDFRVAGRRVLGSSLKFCLIARGEADLYPRLGPTSEWDTAAGHAVLRAAGGSVRTLDGAELGYHKPNFLNPHFVARGRDG